MRIISGMLRGRKLREPADMKIRPTTDMVKESVFNIIQFDIEGRRVLDLFAGTGQLGIEALSRGAAMCVFVDESNEAVRLVKENLKRGGIESGAIVIRSDALSFLEKGEKFDLIFLDPPYDSKYIDTSVKKIIEFDILKDNGIIICESMSDKTIPDIPAPYHIKKEYRYGKIKITLIAKGE